MSARIAFTAGFWGDAAVVCRAIEGRPGPIVEPQFGLFDTWTHANDFAMSLNEGLEIDPLDVRQIVTSAVLATTHLLRTTGFADIAYTDAPVLITANTLQVQLLLAHLKLALTFCRVARTRETEPGTDRILRNAHSAHFLAVTSVFRLQTTQFAGIRLVRFKYTSNSWLLWVVTTKDFGCTASRLSSARTRITRL